MRKPTIVAHRGLHDLHTENTLAAFRAAWDAGIEWCECDVRGSRDRHPFVLHDETLDRTTQTAGRIADASDDELKRAGVPALDELVSAMPLRGSLLVEIKAPSSWHIVRSVVLTCDPRRSVIQSFDPELLRIAADQGTEHPLELLVDDSTQPFAAGPWRGINARFETLNGPVVELLHAIGLRVGAWTVNHDADIRRIISLGVDTIISDNPLRVRDICREIG
jgi:glycerophosphoryl diester phosphodiesterase